MGHLWAFERNQAQLGRNKADFSRLERSKKQTAESEVAEKGCGGVIYVTGASLRSKMFGLLIFASLILALGGAGSDERAQEFEGNHSGEGGEVRENGGSGTGNEERSRAGNAEGLVNFGEGEELRAKMIKLGTGNENRERMQPSLSNNRINPVAIDRLSDLPDALLIHILSFLGVKQAAVTGVLSKRWQSLWSDLPELEFWESNTVHWDITRDGEKIRRFVSWINNTIAIRTSNHLEKFAVYFQYSGCYASDVDAWVEFAIKHKVKKLTLMLNSYRDYYLLHDSIYSNSSMTCLWLRGCIMAPRRTIQWQSLTQLSLKEVELNQSVIDAILSSCPVLFSLDIEECWGFDRLVVNSRSLHRLRLELEDSEDDDVEEPPLEISAPYVHTLDISVFPEGRKLQVRNIQSVVKAYIDFGGYGWGDPTSVDAMIIAKHFMERFHHVKEMYLGRKFFEVVSMMVVDNWQLPQSTRLCFQASIATDYEHSITGILGILESSPNLEELDIVGHDNDEDCVDLDLETMDDVSHDLPNLKTVHIRYFTDPKGEPMLTLARILLKRAILLEKLVIETSDEMLLDDFDDIAHELDTYPVSSPRAVVLLY